MSIKNLLTVFTVLACNITNPGNITIDLTIQ